MPHEVTFSEMEIAVRIRATVQQEVGKEQFDLWFSAASQWHFHSDCVRVVLPSRFLVNCVRKFCWKALKSAVAEVAGSHCSIQVDDLEAESIQPTGRARGKNMRAAAASEGQPPVDARGLRLVPEKSTITSNEGGTTSSGDANSEKTCTSSLSGNTSAGLVPGFGLLAKGEKSIPRVASLSAGSHPPVYCGKGVDSSGVCESGGLKSSGAGPVVRRSDRTAQATTTGSVKLNYWQQFLTGEQNRLAVTAAQMVLEKPGTISPLLLHGPCGVGKTHLARAIGEQLRQRHGLRRVIFLTAEQFTIDFTDSVRGSGFANFRRKYRDLEALVLDDIQFLLGKKSTFNEFRNTLDNLLRNRRQVVLVSDRSLPELAAFGNELHARLAGGMSCAIEALDYDMRLKLLRRLSEEYSAPISDTALDSLARSANGDARILHGIVFRIMAEQRAKDRPLTDDEIQKCTSELIRASQPVIRLADIDKAICDVFGLEPKSLQTKGKCKSVSQPRMLAMFLARKFTRAAYSEIGEYFGNRQHSTVISANRKVEHWVEKNESLSHRRGVLPVREMLRNLESTLQVG